MRLVLVQNTGAIDGTVFADPSAVTAGRLAAFDKNGVGLALNSAIAVDFQLVLGDADSPVITTLIELSRLTEAIKKTYVASVKQNNTLSVLPNGPTGGGEFLIKVIDMTEQFEPYHRFNYYIDVTDGEAAASYISKFAAIINADIDGIVDLSSNLVEQMDITGTSGTANITLDGVNYLATFDTDRDTTAVNFVALHAATILTRHGVTITNPADSDVDFAATPKWYDTLTVTNLTGDLGATKATVTAATTIILTTRLFDQIFSLATNTEFSTITVVVVAPVQGSGRGDRMVDAEQRNAANMSRFWVESGLGGKLDDYAIRSLSTLNYLIYTVMHKNDADLSINRSFEHEEIIIGLATGLTGDLDTFFGTYMTGDS